MASIKKRKDAYCITVSIGYDAQGKKLTRSTTYRPDPYTATGKTKSDSVIRKEVAEYAVDFERKVKSGVITADSSMKFSELVSRYLAEYAFVELTRNTAEGYQNILNNRLVPEFGHMKINDLCHGQLVIQKYFNQLAKTNKGGKRLATSSIRREMAVFSSVMSWAVNMQLIPNNPLLNVRTPKEAYKEPSPKSFTIEELKRFLAALDEPQTATYKAHTRTVATGTVCRVKEYQEQRSLPEQYKLFFVMAALSGARRGELLALTWPDLDFDACTISISKSISKTSAGIIVKSTKTASGVRVVNMPISVMQLAKTWKKHQIEQRLKLGTAWKGHDNIFCQADGSTMYPDSVTARFRQIINNHNAKCRPEEALPEISLHGLRHTAASILINQHTDVATVSKRLGHSRTSVTLDIYTHAIQEADKAAADTLEILAFGTGAN